MSRIIIKSILMKNWYLIASVLLYLLLLSSCRQVHNAILPETNIYNLKTVSELEYIGTMGVSGSPNVLFAEMMTKAREKYGETVTIHNVRFRTNYKSLFGMKYSFQEEVLFDVYQKRK
jgi:hypothetical protein